MTVILHDYGRSSASYRVRIALNLKGVDYDLRPVDLTTGAQRDAANLARNPLGLVPTLEVDGVAITQSLAIIDWLDGQWPAPRLIPADPLAAAEARMWDRFFDNYVAYPQQRLVYIAIGREHDDGGDRWRTALDTAYALLDERMRDREWAAGDFGLADCSAAPQLLYADWSHAIPEKYEALRAYRARLLARPSYARALDEARPYRHFFPLGAPEGRD